MQTMKNEITVKIPEEKVLGYIMEIRGEKVILDRDIASLYGVETNRLNEQVRRNNDRFPGDFMFRLTQKEFSALMSQNATSKRGGTRKLPYAFTEHGVLMLGNVLNSKKAIDASIAVIRAFNKLRKMVSNYQEVLNLLKSYDKKIGDHDRKFIDLYDKVDSIFTDMESKKVGFRLS